MDLDGYFSKLNSIEIVVRFVCNKNLPNKITQNVFVATLAPHIAKLSKMWTGQDEFWNPFGK